jgi:hypothetical protein
MREMSSSPVPFWLYNLHGRPQYIGCGDYTNLLNDIVFFSGLRGYAEKIWLMIQKIYPRHAVQDKHLIIAWKKLPTTLQQTVKSTLLWRTDWYKNTLFVGGVTTDDRRFFVKAYRRPDETLLAVHQASFIHYYFHNYFTTVQPAHYDDSMVFYPLLAHKSNQPDPAAISEKLILIALEHQEIFSANTKPVMDYINLNLPSLLQKNGRIDLWPVIRQTLASVSPMASIPVHGDMTPWNIFNSDHALPVLIDCERAGWHVIFYDWWHFQCQPRIMKFQLPKILELITGLHKATNMDKALITQTGLLYMLDQLAYDLQDQDDYPQQKQRLQQTTQLKIKTVEILLNQLQHAGTK